MAAHPRRRRPADIAGATATTYVLVAADVGATLQVVVKATNAAGTATANSAATAAVAILPASTAAPTIAGKAAVGQTLTATPGTWSGTPPVTFAYQWRRTPAGGAPADIAGATATTYVLVAADVGATLQVVVKATNAAGTATANSAATAAVAILPASTAAPTIAGKAAVGQTLTATPGTWSGTPPVTFAYQWRRTPAGGAPADIAGATATTYVLVAADVGATLQVVVKATNAAGTATANSAATAAVAILPASTAAPTIAGKAAVGQTLTATPGTWSGTPPVTFAYQWRRTPAGGAPADIAGATATTYVLVAADVGATLQVVVKATNAAGTATANSGPTAAVASLGPPPTNVKPPSIVGQPYVGELLSADAGVWSRTPAPVLRYQWLRCDPGGARCVEIPLARGQTYVPMGGEIVVPQPDPTELLVGLPSTGGDVGATLRVVVTATNDGGRRRRHLQRPQSSWNAAAHRLKRADQTMKRPKNPVEDPR